MLIAHLRIEGFQPLPHSLFTLAEAKATTSAVPLAEGGMQPLAEAAQEPLFSSAVSQNTGMRQRGGKIN